MLLEEFIDVWFDELLDEVSFDWVGDVEDELNGEVVFDARSWDNVWSV